MDKVINKIIANLFFLCFVALGSFMMYKAGVPILKKYIKEQGLVEVSAQFLDGQVDWEKTGTYEFAYRAEATYSYTLNGKAYKIDRVETDRRDSTHHVFHFPEFKSRVEAWKDEKKTVLRIDPENPSEYQKEEPIAFVFVALAILLPGLAIFLGIFMLLKINRADKERPKLAENPWLEKEAWRKKVLYCNTARKKRGAFFVAIFSCLITFPPLIIFVAQDEINYLLFITPTIGIVLLLNALIKARDLAQYGTVEMTMDPFPASIGGHFAGQLSFSNSLPPESTIAIKLNCVKKVISKSDKDSREELLWHDVGFAFFQSDGISFKLAIPSHLKESSLSREGIHWRAEITISYDNHHFERQFEVPVFDTGQVSTLTIDSANHPAAKAHVSELINSVTEFKKEGENYHLHFPIFRILRVSLLFGLLVGGGLLTIATLGRLEGFLELPLSLGFGFIGLVFFGLASFESFYSLKVILQPSELISQHKWMGILFKERKITRENLSEFKVGDYVRQNDKGGKHNSYHKVSVINNKGQGVAVAVRLKNYSTADQMKTFFETYYQLNSTEVKN